MKYTVYVIKHIGTGTVLYVGMTKNFKMRVYQHLSLKSNSKYWLAEIGTNNVLIEPVDEFNNKVDALKYEDELILKYNTITNGYNKCRSGLIFEENPEKYQRDYRKEYQGTDEFKEYQRKWQKEYHNTDKFKEYKRKYTNTDKYRGYQRKYQKKYQGTDGFKEYQRNWHRDYYHAKKMGISVDEYRKFKQNKNQPIQLTINF